MPVEIADNEDNIKEVRKGSTHLEQSKSIQSIWSPWSPQMKERNHGDCTSVVSYSVIDKGKLPTIALSQSKWRNVNTVRTSSMAGKLSLVSHKSDSTGVFSIKLIIYSSDWTAIFSCCHYTGHHQVVNFPSDMFPIPFIFISVAC